MSVTRRRPKPPSHRSPLLVIDDEISLGQSA